MDFTKQTLSWVEESFDPLSVSRVQVFKRHDRKDVCRGYDLLPELLKDEEAEDKTQEDWNCHVTPVDNHVVLSQLIKVSNSTVCNNTLNILEGIVDVAFSQVC